MKLRIGILCFSAAGGSGAVAGRLAGGLARRGHDVHVLSDGDPPGVDLDAGIRFHRVETPDYPLFHRGAYGMAAAGTLLRVHERSGLDIVHAHYAFPHALSALLACELQRGRRPSLVTTLHGTDVTMARRMGVPIEMVGRVLERSDLVTAVSTSLARETRILFELGREVRVIPNFVDMERFHPLTPGALPEAEPVLVHCSNLRPVKRAADCLEVLARVQRERPCRLLIVGDGPERGALEESVTRMGLEDTVIFRGWMTGVEEVLRRGSILLLPSEREGFGLAALEALASGVPVVASRSGGVEEFLVHGDGGILCDVGDVDAMARGVLEILADPDTWRLRARASVQGRFTESAGITRYEEAYLSVTAEPIRAEASSVTAQPPVPEP